MRKAAWFWGPLLLVLLAGGVVWLITPGVTEPAVYEAF